MIVRLTWDDIRLAVHEAAIRSINAKKKNIRPAYGMSPNFFEGLRIDCMGCMGEIAAAKGLNLFWSGQHEIHSPDVGGRIEVKTIDSPTKNLIVHPTSKNDAEFSLLAQINSVSTVELVGWIRTSEGRRPEYVFEGRPGHQIYLVPRAKLYPIDALGEELFKTHFKVAAE